MGDIVHNMLELFHSLPSDLQGLLVIIAIPGAIYTIGRLTAEETSDDIEHLVQGWQVTKSKLDFLLGTAMRAIVAVLTGVIQKLSQMIEVEEPLFKIGPLLEIKGAELNILRILAIIVMGLAGGGGVILLL